MKHLLLTCLALALAAPLTWARETEEQTRQDVARHRAMAAAHEAAAKCRESGKEEAVCNRELQAACKGIAIGKYCGMKHEH